MKPGVLSAALCLALASTPVTAAQLYQWKDAQGRTIYSDQPPPPSVRNAQQKNFKGSFIEGGESYAARTAREKHPVVLYTTACGAPCDQARQLLAERGVPYTTKDPQSGPEVQGELQKLTGRLNVPVLVVGNDKVDGFESSQWQGLLDKAGYPKSPTPGRPATPPGAAEAPAAR